MANLDLISRLNENYGKESPIRRQTKLFAINEYFDPSSIKKAISNSVAEMGPIFTQYFDLGLPADVVLMFVDVCGFSIKFSKLSGEEIGNYFDSYYDTVIPIIYRYGGEIDKIMGDGIICIFGPPFHNAKLIENIDLVDQCSKEIIKVTKGTKFESKVAIHCGTINYFKNKTGLYNEFTMIGKPLTELFRLESISIDNRINYYDDTLIRQFYENRIANRGIVNGRAEWTHYIKRINNLKGVHYEQFYSINHNN
ncbi:MAG: adenylate/guanylate cyclase domain-containing protein [Chitinophagales bacterium]